MYKDDLTIWCSYHDPKLIEEYNLDYIPSYIKLFNVNDLNVKGKNINYYSKYISELVTQYYVWKNNIYSKYVGFCHYRRFFMNLGEDNINNYNVHYLNFIRLNLKGDERSYNTCPNYKYWKDILYDYLCKQNFHKFNKSYLDIYFNSTVNVPWQMSYIFKWELFVKVCELTFGFFDHIVSLNSEDGEFEDYFIYKRYLGYIFEWVIGIIIILLNGNILNPLYSNWSYSNQSIALLTKCNDKNKIKKWIKKNNRTASSLYVITDDINIKNEFLDNNTDKIFFIKKINEIPIHIKETIKLSINQYVKCLDYYNFTNKNYTIETFDNDQKYEDDLTIWCSYHDPKLIEEYNLDYIPKYIKLFNTNSFNLNLPNINYLNNQLCELVTFYYVWKNKLYSKYVGFCHYRRFFSNLGEDNVKKYGVHYYFCTNINWVLDSLVGKERYFDKLFDYLKNTKKFDEDLLSSYFENKKELYIGWKISYIFEWDKFNEACELIFGFLNYIVPNYENINNYRNYEARYFAWVFEWVAGVIISLINNNLNQDQLNDVYEHKPIIYTSSNDPNKICKWLAKNNRLSTIIYIISNINKEYFFKEFFKFDKFSIKFIKDENEIKEDDKIKLCINEYIKCLDPINFVNKNYTIETFINE